MKNILLAATILLGETVFSPLLAGVTLDPKTGGFAAFGHSFENRYLLMEKERPDVTALEREDVVVEQTADAGATVFRCTNPKMPGVTITKRYVVDEGDRKSVV